MLLHSLTDSGYISFYVVTEFAQPYLNYIWVAHSYLHCVTGLDHYARMGQGTFLQHMPCLGFSTQI